MFGEIIAYFLFCGELSACSFRRSSSPWLSTEVKKKSAGDGVSALQERFLHQGLVPRIVGHSLVQAPLSPLSSEMLSSQESLP